MNSHPAAPAEKIIVALDVPTRADALRLVEQLSPRISTFKIGLQLYTAEGPDILRAILATGARVFLDLKLHDIPNTVARAVESANKLGVQMLTIHLSGGRAMAKAAVAACDKSLALLGVTLLTSSDQATLRETGVEAALDQHVLKLAQLGVESGINGLVASPLEVKMLRERLGPNIKLIVPGVRPAGAEAADQKRVMTPGEAVRAGADYLVIGRPITAQRDPIEAVERICEELGR
jgi:orotidine-5'-phosphate decarboxylase